MSNPGSVVSLRDTLDRWFAECFQQPPISHNTESYNQALAAKDKLKDLLDPPTARSSAKP